MKSNFFAPKIPFLLLFGGFLCLFNSCTPTKNVIYFENLKKDTSIRNIVNYNLELKIRKNDLLNISIVSPDPVTTPLFNGVLPTTGSSTGDATSGYLVDNNGNIVMYKLGAVRAEGLTANELRSKLQKEVSPYLKDAVITVRFLNNRITMLGEVTKPGIIPIIGVGQIPLLEAIAASGDITLTGRKDNILVIRETPEGKQFKRLNLSDNSIFFSPFYYLKPDDIVYVEPTKGKIKAVGQSQQYISLAVSALSILIAILTLLSK